MTGGPSWTRLLKDRAEIISEPEDERGARTL